MSVADRRAQKRAIISERHELGLMKQVPAKEAEPQHRRHGQQHEREKAREIRREKDGGSEIVTPAVHGEFCRCIAIALLMSASARRMASAGVRRRFHTLSVASSQNLTNSSMCGTRGIRTSDLDAVTIDSTFGAFPFIITASSRCAAMLVGNITGNLAI